jgi:hypothetical protein
MERAFHYSELVFGAAGMSFANVMKLKVFVTEIDARISSAKSRHAILIQASRPRHAC